MLRIGFAIGSAVCWALYILLTQHVGERFTRHPGTGITMPSPPRRPR